MNKFTPYKDIDGGRYRGCSIERQDGSLKIYDDTFNCGALIGIEDSLKDSLNTIDEYWDEFNKATGGAK